MTPLIKKFQYGNPHRNFRNRPHCPSGFWRGFMLNRSTPRYSALSWAHAKPKPGMDFFPLGVHYVEKAYAAGKIPGGFFKREGRPNEKETSDVASY